jgi:hypothetical protein
VLVGAWSAGAAPAALSIVQARGAGLAHFAVGFVGTPAAFAMSSS